MRRLTSLVRRSRDVLADFLHAARAQALAGWVRLQGQTGFIVGTSECAPIPVLLLPGILERSTYLFPLGRFLASQGHPVHIVDTLGWNLSGIKESVERCLEVLHDRDIHGAVLVAHSKGGLIGKALLLDPRMGDAAIGLVAIATPFAGSSFGGPLQQLPLAKRSPLGLFFLNNEDLERLADESDVNSRIVSLAPEWDQMIPDGSHLDGATNVTLKGRGHFRPVDDSEVWEQVHTYAHTLAQVADGEGSVD